MPLTADDKIEIMELASRYNHAIDHRRAQEVWEKARGDQSVPHAGPNGVFRLHLPLLRRLFFPR